MRASSADSVACAQGPQRPLYNIIRHIGSAFIAIAMLVSTVCLSPPHAQAHHYGVQAYAYSLSVNPKKISATYAAAQKAITINYGSPYPVAWSAKLKKAAPWVTLTTSSGALHAGSPATFTVKLSENPGISARSASLLISVDGKTETVDIYQNYGSTANTDDGLKLTTSLVRTYKAVLKKAPQATVYVLDYPMVVDRNKSTCLFPSLATPNAQRKDAPAVADLISRLNKAIKQSVAQVDDARLLYVSANEPDSAFPDHGLCASEPCVRNIDLASGNFLAGDNLTVRSVHPNHKGNLEYGRLIYKSLR